MPNYPNPPITEAVLEIKVSVPADFATAQIEQLHELLPGYPTKKKRRTVESIFPVEGDTAPKTTSTDTGYFFTSENGKQIVQARPDGFALSQLNPYQGWELFSGEAKQLWVQYKRIVQPIAVVGLGLRFVNRLDLPWPFNDFKEFLATAPEVSPKMDQRLSNFVMMIETPQNDIGALLRLTEALVPPPNEDLVSILLDIDIHKNENLSCEDDAIWTSLEQLRNRKNEIFEACITDKTRELFK